MIGAVFCILKPKPVSTSWFYDILDLKPISCIDIDSFRNKCYNEKKAYNPEYNEKYYSYAMIVSGP